jgi:hypothetical protein
MGGRFGKYGEIKRKINIRQSERLKQKVSKQKTSDHRKQRLREKRNR